MVKFSKGHQDYNLGDNEKLYFGTGNDTEMLFNGTNQVLKSAGALLLQVSGDTDDYLEFSTASNLPIIKAIGGSAVFFESDDAGNAGVFAREDATKAVFINYDKTADIGSLGSTHPIRITPSNVTADYFEFSTVSNDTIFKMTTDSVTDTVEFKNNNGDLWLDVSANEVFLTSSTAGAHDSPMLKLVDDDSQALMLEKETAGDALITNTEGNMKITATGGTVDFDNENLTTTGTATTAQVISVGGAANLIDFTAIAAPTSIFTANATANAPGNPGVTAGYLEITIGGAAAFIPYEV